MRHLAFIVLAYSGVETLRIYIYIYIYLGGDSESIHGAMIGPELECCKCRVLPYNYNNNCHPEASGIRKGG